LHSRGRRAILDAALLVLIKLNRLQRQPRLRAPAEGSDVTARLVRRSRPFLDTDPVHRVKQFFNKALKLKALSPL
jgi:hypothetical protein